MKTVSDPERYAAVTAMDKYEVETVVGYHVRAAYLSENGYALADMIRYPITINDIELADADAFLNPGRIRGMHVFARNICSPRSGNPRSYNS